MDRFGSPRAKQLEVIAVAALVIGFGSILLGQAAQSYVRSGELPGLAALRPTPQQNVLDMLPTGTIKAGVVILDPCTGDTKAK